MPSGEDEPFVALAKLNPDIVAWLLTNVFHVKVPEYHHGRRHITDARATTTVGREYLSEHLRELAAQHEARGEARGRAEGESLALLKVLEARGIPVPDEVREQILACTDMAQLDLWLRRAITATTAEDVVRA